MGPILLVRRDGTELFEINFENRKPIDFLNPTPEFVRFITSSINYQYEMTHTGKLNLEESVVEEALKNVKRTRNYFAINLNLIKRKVS